VPFGFRAFDGAPLGTGPVPLSFSFYTSRSAEVPQPACTPSCADIGARLQASGCSRNGCHSREEDPSSCPPGQAIDPNEDCVGVPRMGLSLSGATDLLLTAIGRVAHQTETGPGGGIVLVNPSHMGVQMPIIDPGRPGNSYLLYKLLLRPANFRSPPAEQLTSDELARRASCTPAYRAQLPSDRTLALPHDERQRLREWFVRGEGMPLVARNADEENSPLTLDAMHEIQHWIAQGAACP
jgi:hypothetical protein